MAAAFDYFLRLDGIPGDSTDAKHKDEIVLASFSWGETQPATSGGGGGGGAGKVHIEDLHVTAHTSKASPALLLACASGLHIKSAVLTGRRGGNKPADVLTFTLSDVLVSDYHVAGTGGEAPADSVLLNFSRIEVEFRPQNPDGSLGTPVKAGWDVKANKRI